MKLDTPQDTPTDENGNFSPAWMSFMTRIKDFIIWRSQYGTTAQRPTKGLEIGTPYFDTTLNKPIWLKTVSPIAWVDATGGAV